MFENNVLNVYHFGHFGTMDSIPCTSIAMCPEHSLFSVNENYKTLISLFPAYTGLNNVTIFRNDTQSSKIEMCQVLLLSDETTSLYSFQVYLKLFHLGPCDKFWLTSKRSVDKFTDHTQHWKGLRGNSVQCTSNEMDKIKVSPTLWHFERSAKQTCKQ